MLAAHLGTGIYINIKQLGPQLSSIFVQLQDKTGTDDFMDKVLSVLSLGDCQHGSSMLKLNYTVYTGLCMLTQWPQTNT